jgi:hypothetical protein
MIADGARKDEIEIWRHGWEFNYLIGQLNYVADKYRKKFEDYIENKYYFNQLRKENTTGVIVINKKIDIKFLGKLLKNDKVIIYLDCYYLQKILHAPHFVLALRQDKNFIEIADPRDGKLKKIPFKIIKEGINSLRNHLKYSPVLITCPHS